MENTTATEITNSQAISDINLFIIIGCIFGLIFIYCFWYWCCRLCHFKKSKIVGSNIQYKYIDLPPPYLVSEKTPSEYTL